MMNLVDASVLQDVIASTGQANQAVPPQSVPPPQTYATPPVRTYGTPPPSAYPQTSGFAAPVYAQRPAAAPAGVDPQRLALMQQVMSLTEDQINSLRPEQRAQINLLRQQFAAGQI